MAVDLVRIAGALVWFVALGCGDDAMLDSGPTDSGPMDGTADEGIDTFVPPVLESLTVQVIYGSAPARTALVGLVAPGGDTMEARTEPSGRVTFEGLDWSLGEASLTAYFDAGPVSYAVSAVGLTRELAVALSVDGAFVLHYPRPGPPIAPPEWVGLTGSALNRTVGASSVSVIVGGRSSIGGAFLSSGATAYTLDVERGVPFTLFAVETGSLTPTPLGVDHPSFAWARVDSTGIDSAASIDVDFADPVEPERVSGFVNLPAHLDPGARPLAVPVTLIARDERQRPLDRPASFGYDAGRSRLEFSHEYLLATGASAEDYRTLFVLTEPDVAPVAHGSTWFEVDGLPVAGEQTYTPLDLPRIDTSEPGEDYPRASAIDFEVFDDDVEVALDLFARTASAVPLRWIVKVMSGSSVIVPPLPASIDEEELTSGAALEGSLLVSRQDGTATYGAYRSGIRLVR